MPANGFGLGEGGDFTANIDAENQTLINHKCVCGARIENKRSYHEVALEANPAYYFLRS